MGRLKNTITTCILIEVLRDELLKNHLPRMHELLSQQEQPPLPKYNVGNKIRNSDLVRLFKYDKSSSDRNDNPYIKTDASISDILNGKVLIEQSDYKKFCSDFDRVCTVFGIAKPCIDDIIKNESYCHIVLPMKSKFGEDFDLAFPREVDSSSYKEKSHVSRKLVSLGEASGALPGIWRFFYYRKDANGADKLSTNLVLIRNDGVDSKEAFGFSGGRDGSFWGVKCEKNHKYIGWTWIECGEHSKYFMITSDVTVRYPYTSGIFLRFNRSLPGRNLQDAVVASSCFGFLCGTDEYFDLLPEGISLDIEPDKADLMIKKYINDGDMNESLKSIVTKYFKIYDLDIDVFYKKIKCKDKGVKYKHLIDLLVSSKKAGNGICFFDVNDLDLSSLLS